MNSPGLWYELKADFWKRRGRTPGGRGWNAAKWVAIRKAIADSNGHGYGADDGGIDERVVEYGWVFDRLRSLRLEGQPCSTRDRS